MEYTQWDMEMFIVYKNSCVGLNPCCNGIYSMSMKKHKEARTQQVKS